MNLLKIGSEWPTQNCFVISIDNKKISVRMFNGKTEFFTHAEVEKYFEEQ